MYYFFNGDLFQTIVILFVGFFTFIAIRIQMVERKKQIAMLLLMEIRSIESKVEDFKAFDRDGGDVYTTQTVISTNSWEKYKHHFANDLNEDEHRRLNNFYDLAQRIEQERKVLRNQIILVFEGKAKGLQEQICLLAAQNLTDEGKFHNDIRELSRLVGSNTPDYVGSRPRRLMVELAQECPDITTSSAGTELRKISKKKWYTRK